MRNARIDSSEDLEGQTVVFACFDLDDEEVEAAAHAIRTTSAERYRTADLSADDVLHLRELTAIVDELVEQGAGMRTVVLSPARLTAFRKAIGRYVESRTEAEWIREEDRGPLELVSGMTPALELLCEEAIRAALSPLNRRAGHAP